MPPNHQDSKLHKKLKFNEFILAIFRVFVFCGKKKSFGVDSSFRGKRRDFQRKMLSYDIINRLEERKTGGAHKAPFLYEFYLENYQKALQNGLYGGW